MNSLVLLIAAVACLAHSSLASGYAGVYPGAYGQGALLAGGAYGAGVGAYGAGVGAYGAGVGAYRAGVGVVGAYHGPLATPVVLPSGFLADTPEVAAAKGAHLAALSTSSGLAATTGAGANGAGSYGGGSYGAGAYGSGNRYAGPLAVPVVLPSGYLADTHDVAAARGAHLTAVASSASRAASYGGAYGHGASYYH